MSTPETPAIPPIDNATALRILSHLTSEMREELPDAEQNVIGSADEARAVVAKALALGGYELPSGAEGLLTDEATAAAQARVLLQTLWDDDATRPKLEELLAHPPDDSQRSVTAMLATAVILGALVTWLQTKATVSI